MEKRVVAVLILSIFLMSIFVNLSFVSAQDLDPGGELGDPDPFVKPDAPEGPSFDVEKKRIS